MDYQSATFAIIALASGAGVMAGPTSLPSLEKLRFGEDYSGLASLPQAGCWPNCWKYLPLGKGPDRYLTLGGELRQRYEYTNNPTFGEDEQDKRGAGARSCWRRDPGEMSAVYSMTRPTIRRRSPRQLLF